MFNHLLQISSFKSGPQNYTTPVWAIIVFTILFTGVHGYALSFTPGNELVRMFIASFVKVVVLGVVMLGWMRSVKVSEFFKSTLMLFIFVSLLAEIVKLPLTTLIRDAKLTSDVTTAAILSIPLIAVTIWQYLVWYYGLNQVAGRTKAEVIAVIICFVLVSEVAGYVTSMVGMDLQGFEE